MFNTRLHVTLSLQSSSSLERAYIVALSETLCRTFVQKNPVEVQRRYCELRYSSGVIVGSAASNQDFILKLSIQIYFGILRALHLTLRPILQYLKLPIPGFIFFKISYYPTFDNASPINYFSEISSSGHFYPMYSHTGHLS